jgi:hypothetical protein
VQFPEKEYINGIFVAVESKSAESETGFKKIPYLMQE